MSALPNLSELPHDVLVVIAKRLTNLEDFVCFRCVSKSLLAAAKDEYFEGLRCRKRTPYLLLPVTDGNDDVRELYSLVEGESIVASVKAPNLKTKKCFESLGWLLAVGEDGNMSLFEPFSDTAEIPLPHQATFPGYELVLMDEHVFIQKMVLSSRPSENSEFVLMVIAGGQGHLAFWRLGDKAWNRIERREGAYSDVVYNGNGQFYAIGYPGYVYVFNLADTGDGVGSRLILHCDPIVPLYQPMGLFPDYPSMNLYILKTDDTLLMITRMSPNLSQDGLHYMTSKFKVYDVDIDMGTWKEIYSLGSMAVIVGHSATIALDASSSRFPGGVIKPNHIYFTDDDWEYYHFHSKAKGGGKNMGVYNMETATVEPIYPGEPLLSKVSTTIWITPCF